MPTITRRNFAGGLGLWAGASALTRTSYSQAPGSNERVQLALVGCGGRGSGVTSAFAGRADAIVTTVCDLNSDRSARTAKGIADIQDGRMPVQTKRMEDVFASKDVDAVVVATPDHWHTPTAILACQAGKDVYVEKPFCHNVWEGRRLVDVARQHKRIVQVGTQNRSAPYNLAAREYLQSGKLGDVRLVKVYNLKGGGRFELGDPGKAPDGFDWNAWLGPAGQRPYHTKIFHGGWHQFWDYSGGDLADCGIHQLDLALMVMGSPPPPKTVSAVGGRMHHIGDDAEVPDVEIIHYEFEDFVMTFEHTHYAAAMSKIDGGIRSGDRFPNWPLCATRIEFYGSKDIMMLGRHGGGWQVFTSGGNVVEEAYGRHPDPQHQNNFIECIKSRKAPNADVALAQSSHSVMHIGNISHRVGNRQLSFDGDTEQFVKDDAANLLLKRQNVNLYSVKS
jgi:predicted dehydrogenase